MLYNLLAYNCLIVVSYDILYFCILVAMFPLLFIILLSCLIFLGILANDLSVIYLFKSNLPKQNRFVQTALYKLRI